MGLIIDNFEDRGTNKALKMNALMDSGARGIIQ